MSSWPRVAGAVVAGCGWTSFPFLPPTDTNSPRPSSHQNSARQYHCQPLSHMFMFPSALFLRRCRLVSSLESPQPHTSRFTRSRFQLGVPRLPPTTLSFLRRASCAGISGPRARAVQDGALGEHVPSCAATRCRRREVGKSPVAAQPPGPSLTRTRIGRQRALAEPGSSPSPR